MVGRGALRAALESSPLGQRRTTDLRVGIVVVFTVSLLILASHWHENRRGGDDAYITYRYAENLARGHGFVFNVGDPAVLGTSTPLYTGLLALGGFLGADIPRLSIALGILATATALALVACIAWEFRRLSAGLIVGITSSVAQLYWRYWQGMETSLYLALILSAVWAAYRGRASLALLAGALATVTRLDGLAVLVVVGLFLSAERRVSWRACIPGAAVLLAWLIPAILLFGSPLPASGLAKMGHEARISGRFSAVSPLLIWQALPVVELVPASVLEDHPLRTTALLALLLAAPVAGVLCLRPRRLSVILVGWLAFYIAGYEFLGLPNFAWYYGPAAIVLGLFLWMVLQAALAFGVNAIAGPGELVASCTIWVAATSAIIAVLAAAQPAHPKTPREQELTRQRAGTWLREHARAGETLVAYEVGTVAYLSGLKTIDLLGLTDPRARDHLQRRDFAWAIRERPTYVFSNEAPGSWPVTQAIFHAPEFALRYRPVARLPFREDTDYVIYELSDQGQPVGTGGPWSAEWVDVHHPTSIRRGLTSAFSLTMRNLSTSSWRRATPDGLHVTYHWLSERGHRVVFEEARTPMPCDVRPGQRVLVSARVRAPALPGRYILSWDLVREGQGFFSDHGVASPSAPVLVY